MMSDYFRKIFITLLGIGFFTLCQAQIKDQLLPLDRVQLEGYIAEKLNAAYQNRILSQNTDKLVEPFANRTETSCWQSEFWGKWFTSAVLAYQYQPTPALKLKLDKAVNDLLATQDTEGYIGNYAPDKHLHQWDIWGRKYCILGLLSYYDLTKDVKSLQASRRIVDHLMKELSTKNALIVSQGNHRGMAASSILEPILGLYNRTKDKKYLDFALDIVKQWESPEGPQLISKSTIAVAERFPKPPANKWYTWQQGQKAYEMMSCYEGLLELYRITGTAEYLKAVENTWQNIKDTEINIVGSGASVECWFGGKNKQTQPIEHYQETCVTVTWLKLSYQLFRLTGKAQYADAIEQSYYNALLGSMTADGADWAKYTPINGQRRPGDEQCKMGLNCCVASGPRGLFLLPQSIVMQCDAGASINFFVAGRFNLKTPENQTLTISQQTNYPATGKIVFKLTLNKPETFEIKIRIPNWSINSTLQYDSKTMDKLEKGSYMTLKKQWQNNEEIILELDMRGQIVKTADHFLAIQRGPLVLARDARLKGESVDESIKPYAIEERFLEVIPQTAPSNAFWFVCKAPFYMESYTESKPKAEWVELCDYASAGNTYSSASRFRIWFQQLFTPRE